IIAVSFLVKYPSSYCLLVSKTPIVPSPIQEANASIDERPGKRNKGRIIFVMNEPINSNKPKFVNKGRKNPANKNTENNTCNKSSNNNCPVSSPEIASVPNWK